jgi:murein DD-endopeptidase MepM/ murein hydrolase activator NlpD
MTRRAIHLSRWLVFAALIAALFLPATLYAVSSAQESWIVPGRVYYFPVQPPAIARYSNVHHDYPATDIFVPVGSTVVAVTNGVVDEVSRVDLWNPKTNDGAQRGGLWVTIIGDDGVRYHTSHLSKVLDGIEPGARVQAGQCIGLSGKTGNARTTPAHVHFGISRPTHAGDWKVRRGQVKPFVYLNAWKRGKDLKPVLP